MISILIKELQNALKLHGDYPIVLRDKSQDAENRYCIHPIANIGLVKRQKPHDEFPEFCYLEIGERMKD